MLHCSTGGVTGWSADGEQIFSPMFYSFMVSAGIPCGTDRHLEKRENAACERVMVAKKVLMDLSEQPAPLRSCALHTRDESAHGFGSCGYWLSFCAFEPQENVTVSDGIRRKDLKEVT